jgi:DNA replication protein DnaC
MVDEQQPFQIDDGRIERNKPGEISISTPSARGPLADDLRQLRLDAQRLNTSLVERLKAFQKKNGSFKTLPDSTSKSPQKGAVDISVASTCTVLMAAIAADKHEAKEKLFVTRSAFEVFEEAVVKANWGSSGLTDGNAFTTAIVVRCAGVFVELAKASRSRIEALKHARFEPNEQVAEKTLKQIVLSKAQRGEASFAVENYPPKATHAYWFVDGVTRMKVALPKRTWKKIASWSKTEFYRQLLYVSTGNDALMDPPSLAMAACLINRIRRMTDENPRLAEIGRELPSATELEIAVEQVFATQAESGIWHKYFPLFHFPKGGGAADYCFSFEFLEALLVEFGAFVLNDARRLERIKLVLRWCDAHELVFRVQSDEYRGWNSGGEVRNLEKHKPESWATASVHMFLTELEHKINDLLDELVLKRFGKDRRAVRKSRSKFENLVDASLTFSAEEPTTLKKVIRTELFNNIEKLDAKELARKGIPVPRSILLFGPPGTSKSRLAKAIAEYLGWPLVTITPSEFLRSGSEQVHAQVHEVFSDLMDLRKAVVFFDEMDALAQTREGAEAVTQGAGNLDLTRQLLTTNMLPKLANLWDQKRVVFLMATNHKQQLDPAITRPNRFDLLLCVPPPPWRRKCSVETLETILKIPEPDKVFKELSRLVPIRSHVEKRLNAFTVAEVGIFLHHLGGPKSKVLRALKRFKQPTDFSTVVDEWAKTNITLRSGGVTLKEFGRDFYESRRQYFPGQE